MKELAVIIAVLLSHSVLAQTYYKINPCNNAVKLSVSSLALNNVHFKYERAVNPDFSFQVSLAKYLPMDLVKRFSNKTFSWRDYEVDLNDFNELEFYGHYLTIPKLNLKGFYTQGEVRWYPGKKDILRGFYLAPFYTYQMASLNNVEAFDSNENFYNGNVSIQYFGGGLQSGIQWVLKKYLIIDFHFLGLGWGTVKNSVSYTTDNPEIDYSSQIEDFNNFIETNLKTDNKKYTIEAKNNQLNYDLKMGVPVLRSGVSVGIVF